MKIYTKYIVATPDGQYVVSKGGGLTKDHKYIHVHNSISAAKRARTKAQRDCTDQLRWAQEYSHYIEERIHNIQDRYEMASVLEIYEVSIDVEETLLVRN